MKTNAQLFIFILVFSQPAWASATTPVGTCAAITAPKNQRITETHNKLDQIFADNFRSDGLYIVKKCQDNVVRLFAAFNKELPELEPEDFKVLFIAPSLWIETNSLNNDNFFKVKKARHKYEPKFESISSEYTFHVVLEYQGRIYDLDYTNHPKPVSKKEYLKDNFFNSDEAIASSLALSGTKNITGLEQSGEITKEQIRVLTVPSKKHLNYDFKIARKQDYLQVMLGNIRQHSLGLIAYLSN